jgi:amphi-Trp domain-containing protein
MRDTREFVFDGPYTRDELAEVMLLIAAGIRAGGLSLSMGQDEVTVFPRGALELDVVARTKDDKSRIDIAIAWRPAEGDMPASRWCDGAAGDQAGTGSVGNPEREPVPAVSPYEGARESRGQDDAAEETSGWVTRRGSSSKDQPRRPRRPSS